MSQTRTPAEWMDALNRIALEIKYTIPGNELRWADWEYYYVDGLSPREALEEDLSCQ